jgi:hypothetical protein
MKKCDDVDDDDGVDGHDRSELGSSEYWEICLRFTTGEDNPSAFWIGGWIDPTNITGRFGEEHNTCENSM